MQKTKLANGHLLIMELKRDGYHRYIIENFKFDDFKSMTSRSVDKLLSIMYERDEEVRCKWGAPKHKSYTLAWVRNSDNSFWSREAR